MITITGTIRDNRRVYTGNNAIELLKEFLDETKVEQISTLTQQVASLSSQNSFPKDYYYVVDGKPVLRSSANLKLVKHLGRIEAVAKEVEVINLVRVYDDLIALSPRDTGLYVKNHYVLLNGRIIATNVTQLYSYLKNNPLRFNDVLTFTNRTPYARRLEYKGVFGKISGLGEQINKRQIRMKQRSARVTRQIRLTSRNATANGVYYRVASKVRRQYKSLNSKFTFRTARELGFEIPITGRQKYRTTFAKGNKHQIGRSYLYPCIEIKVVQGTTI